MDAHEIHDLFEGVYLSFFIVLSLCAWVWFVHPVLLSLSVRVVSWLSALVVRMQRDIAAWELRRKESSL